MKYKLCLLTGFLNYGTMFLWPLTLLAVAVDLLLIGGGYFVFRGYFGV